MKKMIAWAGTWTFWAIGHGLSKLMNYWPTEFLHPYPLYNRAMIASSALQDWGGAMGPWSTLEAV